MGIIYCYTNKITGMRYVGQTVSEKQRKKDHQVSAFKRQSPFHFHQALRDFGVDGFEYEILEDCQTNDRQILSEREKHWIVKLNTLFPNGYNAYIQPCILTKEIREKIGNAHRGKIMSPESRLKMSIAGKGRKFSEEHKRKIGEANRRRKVTDETKKKIGDAHRGKIISEETRLKMSIANKGKTISEKQKECIRESNRRRAKSFKNQLASEITPNVAS